MFRPFVITKDNPCMGYVSVMRPITNDVENIILHNKSWAVTDHQMILGCSHLAVNDCLDMLWYLILTILLDMNSLLFAFLLQGVYHFVSIFSRGIMDVSLVAFPGAYL